MKASLGFVALAGCLSTFSVSAAGLSHGELYQALAQCQATKEQVAEFNELASSGQLSLPKDEENSPWGGNAWQVKPALTVQGVSSTNAVSSDKYGFYILIKTDTPQVDAAKLASTLKLEKKLDMDGYVDYKRDHDARSLVRVMSTEDKNHDLYLGCAYKRQA